MVAPITRGVKKSWKFEALKLEEQLEIKEKQIKALEAIIKNPSHSSSDNVMSGDLSTITKPQEPIAPVDTQPKKIEEKLLEKPKAVDTPEQERVEGLDVEPKDVAPIPKPKEPDPVVPSEDLQLDGAIEDKKAEDYKHQCSECNAYFDEFKDKTLCPNCDFDWSEQLGEKDGE